MAFDRFLIAPIGNGLALDTKPWLQPDDAFEELENVYDFRGRIRKRFGSLFMGTSQLTSRLRLFVDNTDINGDINDSIPLDIVPFIGQQFSAGTEIFTITSVNPGLQDMMHTGGATVAKFNAATRNVVINGTAGSTPLYFYPSNPVMGITNYQNGPITNQPSYAFDTQFAYTWAGGGWVRSGTNVWHGDNLDFFWAFCWQGSSAQDILMYVTNFNATPGINPPVTDDSMYYFDGTNWVQFEPVVFQNTLGRNQFIKTARIIVAFHSHLLLLNTIENNDAVAGYPASTNYHFPFRCRFSFLGSPIAPNAFLEANQTVTIGGNPYQGKGGSYIDAPTEEQIVSAQFIKDRLIVFFERSTWEIAYTGIDYEPFVWQKLNTELGSVGTFSSVPFDKQILTIGSSGVHACNGSNVERIDSKIPDEVFKIKSKNYNTQRIAGIRDFYTELVYWSFPQTGQKTAQPYPQRLLVFNYRNGAWSFFDDSFTAFGYFEQQDDVTWATAQNTWASYAGTWSSGATAAQFRQIIAGNQQGYVLILSPDTARNAPSLSIAQMTNIGYIWTLTIIDHNLQSGDYIVIENTHGLTNVNGKIYAVTYVSPNTVSIIDDAPLADIITGTYSGGGTVARVSNMFIATKRYNPYVSQGRNVYLGNVDFAVSATGSGEITVDYTASSSHQSLLAAAYTTGTLLGTNVLETKPYPRVPFEATADTLWHRIYFQSDGEFIQMDFYLTDQQIRTPGIAFADFDLQGFILFTKPTTMRLQ